MPDNLLGQIARLECPSELADGAWGGPIYVRLLEQLQAQPGEPSVFVVDDRSRRPVWLCHLIFYAAAFDDAPSRLDGMAKFATTLVVIPLSRLTRPFEDLTREMQDRPLLLLFRFVRFNACYVSCGTRSYREVLLDVFLVGQIVAYFPTNGASFSTPSGASAQPSCGFMCVVALRAEEESAPIPGVISSSIAWTLRISRDEFIAGWCHGVAAAAQPSRRLSRFRSRWADLVIPEQPVADIRRLLYETFVPPGSDSTVNFDDGALRVVSEYGRIISVQPLEYARKYIGPNRPSTRLDEQVDSDGVTFRPAGYWSFSRPSITERTPRHCVP